MVTRSPIQNRRFLFKCARWSNKEAFLWTILRHLCVDAYRRRDRETLVSPHVLEACDDSLSDIPGLTSQVEADPLTSFLQGEERALVLRALELTDNANSRAILLGLTLLSHKEIRNILGTTGVTRDVAGLGYESRVQLRKCLEHLSSRELTPLTAQQFAQELGELIHQRFGLKLESILIPVGLYEPLAKVTRHVLEEHRVAQTGFEAAFIFARCCYNSGLFAEAQDAFNQLLCADIPETLQVRIRCDFARLLQEQPLRCFRRALWCAAYDRTWPLATMLSRLPGTFIDVLQQSEAQLIAAQSLIADSSEPVSEIYIAHRLGNIALVRMELETALHLYNTALEHAEKLSRKISIHHLLKSQSKVYTCQALQARAAGDDRQAVALLTKSEHLLTQCLEAMPGYRKGEVDTYLEKGIVAIAQENTQSAHTFFLTAFHTAEEIGTPNHATDALFALQRLSAARPLTEAVHTLAEELGDIRQWATVQPYELAAQRTFTNLLDAVPGLRAHYETAVAESQKRGCEKAFWRVIFHTLRFLIYAAQQLEPVQFHRACMDPRGLWRITESAEPWATEKVFDDFLKRYRHVE